MEDDVKGGQYVIQKFLNSDIKREIRTVTLKPEEIRQFNASSKNNEEIAKARRLKERSQIIIKEMEAKIKEQEAKAEKKAEANAEAEAEDKKEQSTQKFDPNNLSFEAFLGN